ncbi:MAG: hypothetical protein CCU26_12750 [Nitrospira sp. UW-LDO-01]|nr:MAG: hypothetical protein CCU26_12750 [Nitrospira sp. UW-LDO-01]
MANQKEGTMKVTNMRAIGLLVVVAATGIASESFASDASRASVIEERIGHGGSTYGQPMPDGASECRMKGGEPRDVDVIERIGTGGSTYSFSGPKPAQAGDYRVAGKRVEVVERIGHGGSTYSFRQPMAAQGE